MTRFLARVYEGVNQTEKKKMVSSLIKGHKMLTMISHDRTQVNGKHATPLKL